MAKPPVRVTDAVTAKAVMEARYQRLVSKNTKVFSRVPVDMSTDRAAFFLARTHLKQKAFLEDACRYKALLCPRGTGKTTSTLFHTLMSAERHPRSTIAYIVPDSKAHAKDLFWLPLQEMNAAMNLGLDFKEVEKRVVHPNGTQILILGAHDKDSPARLRGIPFSLVILDECKDFGPHFEELIVEAVVPRLGDYNGTLILAGTPGQVLDGLFFRITQHKPEGWSVHVWIKSDNTFLEPNERDLDWIEKNRYLPFGLDRNSPKFRREQLAEWVADDSERAYLYDERRNGWLGELNPAILWDYICGVDLGKRDKTVFTVAAFSQYDPNLYFVDCFAQSGMTIETIAFKWRELNNQYAFVATVADTGGLGVMIVDNINERWGCGWKPADKKPNYKKGAIEQMNSDFRSGRIKAKMGSILTSAWIKNIRDPKTQLPLHSDEGDSALYTFMESYHWTGATPEPLPIPGSSEYWQEQERRDIQEAVKRQKNRTNWMSNAPSDRDY